MEKSIVLREGYAHLRKTRTAFIGGLLILLVILIGIAVTLGSAEFTVAESYIAILAGLFPNLRLQMADIIVWDYRLHRVLFAVVAGLGLRGRNGDAGSRNPLAPLLGISQPLPPEHRSSSSAQGSSMGYHHSKRIPRSVGTVAIYGMARYRGVSSETMILPVSPSYSSPR